MAELAELDADACIDIATEIIDDRDATIARLTKERDEARRSAEALRSEIARLTIYLRDIGQEHPHR